MTTSLTRRLLSLVPAALLSGCGAESPTEVDDGTAEPPLHAFARSEWSAPVNLGSPVNSTFNESAPVLSKDGLTLYFSSNRPGGLGGNDIWISQRDCPDCVWQAPVNLGPGINSSANDAPSALSIDEHLLFIASNRPGGPGLNDLYVSRRADPQDDFGWGLPVLLGPDVNTAAFEAVRVSYVPSSEEGRANFYFSRGPSGGGAQTIYYAAVTRDGETLGPAVPVPELGSGAGPTIRKDGRELFFQSDRGGLLGEIWVSTRRSVRDPWSPPVNLGAPVNSPSVESQPYLSFDGRTLLFVSFLRPGGIGGQDIWTSTRTPSGR